MAFNIPTVFDVNAKVQQDEPLKVEIRIGQKVVLVSLALMLTALVWKKVNR